MLMEPYGLGMELLLLQLYCSIPSVPSSVPWLHSLIYFICLESVTPLNWFGSSTFLGSSHHLQLFYLQVHYLYSGSVGGVDCVTQHRHVL